MSKILSTILKDVKYPVMFFVASLIPLFLSFMSEVPSPANQWSLKVAPSANLMIFLTGLGMMMVSVALFVYTTQIDKKPSAPTTHALEVDFARSSQSTAKLSPSPPRMLDSSGLEHPSRRGLSENETVDTFNNLTSTQKAIIHRIYTLHRGEISVDELYSIQQKYTPGIIKSQEELYYRVKDLANKKMVDLRAVGQKTSVVMLLEHVKDALSKNRLVLS